MTELYIHKLKYHPRKVKPEITSIYVNYSHNYTNICYDISKINPVLSS